MSNRSVQVYMVVAGDYHDMDYARLELLKLLAENERIRVHVAENYHDLDAINACDWLVTYTCNLVSEVHEQEALRDFVAGGKKWFALHGTNSILRFLDNGKVDSPEIAPVLMETLGTQFIAHPHALFGSVDGVCEELERRREAYGISYITVRMDAADAFAPVVARLAGT